MFQKQRPDGRPAQDGNLAEVQPREAAPDREDDVILVASITEKKTTAKKEAASKGSARNPEHDGLALA